MIRKGETQVADKWVPTGVALMPWKESSVMEERLRFVARLLKGEAMSSMYREFSISRKTGYKIFNRYKAFGAATWPQLFDPSFFPILVNQLSGVTTSLRSSALNIN
jgi:hypothetical protein